MDPWQGDASSLVEAFRRGERSPEEELAATLQAIDRSKLNAFSHLAAEEATEAAAAADVNLPFGGVPMAVKQLEPVAGWPFTFASKPLADAVAEESSTQVERLRRAGAVVAGQASAPEFGPYNYTYSVAQGATRSPWALDRTAGGSSGGSAAAVAGGLVPIATASDGGGSIRIPAGFSGLVGLKVTHGRIPTGPGATPDQVTTTFGCLSRSVRDTARWLDVTSGYDPGDSLSLPYVGGWEHGLGRQELAGRRAVVSPGLGCTTVAPDVAELVTEAAAQLVDAAGLRQVDVTVDLPRFSGPWAVAGGIGLLDKLGEHWPGCAEELTPVVRELIEVTEARYGVETAIRISRRRREMHQAMAELFAEADIVICASNPDVAFGAEGPMPTEVDGREVRAGNNSTLTVPANVYGNPAISIPVGTVRGLPVGMQVMALHHREAWLLDLAAVMERERPWPLVAPGSPH